MQLNPMRPFLGIGAMLVVGYVIYILLSSNPLTRMNRICTPVTKWPAAVVVSGVRIFSPKNAEGVQHAFDNGFHTCRRWVWGALYRDDYLKMKARKEKERENKAKQGRVSIAPSTPGKGEEL